MPSYRAEAPSSPPASGATSAPCTGSDRLSNAFHPQPAYRTKRANGVMEQYLRSYISHQPDEWAVLLGMAKFAPNNHISDTTASPWAAGAPLPLNNFVAGMNNAHDNLPVDMRFLQAKQDQHANATRSPAPHLALGNRIWFSTKNIKTTRPSKKLDHKRLGYRPNPSLSRILTDSPSRDEDPAGLSCRLPGTGHRGPSRRTSYAATPAHGNRMSRRWGSRTSSGLPTALPPHPVPRQVVRIRHGLLATGPGPVESLDEVERVHHLHPTNPGPW